MQFSEFDLEEMLWKNLESKNFDELSKRGLKNVARYDLFLRQVNLGPYGVLDIVCLTFRVNNIGQYVLNVNVVELKKEEINTKTFMQALRYCKGIQHFLLQHWNYEVAFEITLIGTSIDTKSDFVYLGDIFETVSIFTVELSLQEGITFIRHCGYSEKSYENLAIPKWTEKVFRQLVRKRLEKILPFEEEALSYL